MRKYPVYTIKQRLSWQRIDKALGLHLEYGTRRFDGTRYPCGLTGGFVFMRVYTFHDQVEGTSSIHIVRHLDGVCISGSLNVDVDNTLAKETFLTLCKAYQVPVSLQGSRLL